MKTTLEKESAMGILPMPSGLHGRDARATTARGRKRAALFVGKDFWRVLSNASLPQAPTLRRLHD